ncbi:U-box domain-containing protein 45-like [Telopea speciosissima]|uniref:U-box domain-containing protein 45-like n=1 Tax=Telopea speciosissima TaxID=54955 RepID=UPI001CC6002E|nr:U-box domain-containing protein 45-like [Telopea speciosissima]
MDVAEVEESLFAASDAKLHAGMCSTLSAILCKILDIFPVLEAARPRSKSGIQALCSLHVALEKAKNLLQHCSDCSKLYLAITGDSVRLKFEKARVALAESLRRVEDIVPEAIGSQISEIVTELKGTVFSVDLLEKQVGDEVITLLQQERKFNSNCNDNNELEIFHQAALKLGITSSRAALTERRALKKLIERARLEEDKRKESIVACLLHLMRKYSKVFRNEFSDDNDSQGSAPCSPTVLGFLEDGSGGQAFDRQFSKLCSKLCSFSFKSNGRRSGQMAVPPEELRCPISLQLMYDPVIISSGQTYERICIEKWFSDGHRTCPKTQQQLSHQSLTPNYCVKGLVSSWCEHNGVPVPDGPPESLDLNYWRLALSESESTDSRSMESVSSCKLKGVKVVPMEESGVAVELERNEVDDVSCPEEVDDLDMARGYDSLLAILDGHEDAEKQCKVVEQIRLLLKDDEEARICMGANGFLEALVRFLEAAVREGNQKAQGIGAMALFNLAVNNDRNKKMMLSAGVIPLLEEMILKSNSYKSATALYLNLSCLEEAKPVIGSSQAIPFLVRLLQNESEPQCKLDALHCLYNLSIYPSNIPILLSAGIIEGLHALLVDPVDHTWTEKSIAVLINLASNNSGKKEIASIRGLISALSAILDSGEAIEQEQAVSCLLILCNGNDNCSELVLEEGVIPALVSISVNGTARGKERAQKLLMLFREQRQRDPLPVVQTQKEPKGIVFEDLLPSPEPKPLCKSGSRRAMSRAWASLWKTKNYSSSSVSQS